MGVDETFGAPIVELRAWPGLRVVREIPHANRASRTWEVRVDTQRCVAKLTFDRLESVEPGLHVAVYVEERTGLPTGRPIAASNGSIAVPVTQPDDKTWTLAVLDFVDGDAIQSFTEDTSYAAGRLLGRIHQALADDATPAVPGRLLDWYRSVGGSDVARLVGEIEAHDLTLGVVYGDPSPELLRRRDGTLALIDWGTPSYGPLMYDLATWESHVAAFAADDAAISAAALRTGYLTASPCRPAEVDVLPHLKELWRWLTTGSP